MNIKHETKGSAFCYVNGTMLYPFFIILTLVKFHFIISQVGVNKNSYDFCKLLCLRTKVIHGKLTREPMKGRTMQIHKQKSVMVHVSYIQVIQRRCPFGIFSFSEHGGRGTLNGTNNKISSLWTLLLRINLTII